VGPDDASQRSLGAQRNWPVVFRSSWLRQEWRLIWIELHVEDSKQCCRRGIIAHQRDKIDQSTVANWRNDRAKVADVTFLAPKISRPSSMTIASASSRLLVPLRCLMMSMISRDTLGDYFRFVR
jgi:hypothetical protein